MVGIELALLPSLLKNKDSKLCIVLDVLRATSTITTLIANGCRAVIPVCETDQAISLRNSLLHQTPYRLLLCGEDSIGQLNRDFDLYNSPAKLSSSTYENSIVIMKSTSGTKLLSSLRTAQELIVASALNLDACAAYALAKARDYNGDISIICAGSHESSQVTFEDVICAGLLVKRMSRGTDAYLNDSAKLAVKLWDKDYESSRLNSVFEESDTGIRLRKAGEIQDIQYCSQLNITSVVPVRISSFEGIGDDVIIIGNEKM